MTRAYNTPPPGDIHTLKRKVAVPAGFGSSIATAPPSQVAVPTAPLVLRVAVPAGFTPVNPPPAKKESAFRWCHRREQYIPKTASDYEND